MFDVCELVLKSCLPIVNLGAVRFERGQYAEAERYYRDALAITRGWYGDAHPRTAAVLTMLGRALVYQERLDEAVPLLEQALAVVIETMVEPVCYLFCCFCAICTRAPGQDQEKIE